MLEVLILAALGASGWRLPSVPASAAEERAAAAVMAAVTAAVVLCRSARR